MRDARFKFTRLLLGKETHCVANRGWDSMQHRLCARLLRLKILADVLGQQFLLFCGSALLARCRPRPRAAQVRDELSARVRGGARLFARTTAAFELA